MGSNLRRQLREALPPSIKGLQRAVALEIADDARYNDAGDYDPEHGRRSKARLADVVRWTAAKDELSVREMLRRLSLAGWEFRVPIGKDKNGSVMYAVPGKAMTFRVPDFEGPTTVGPYVETEVEGPTTVGPRANHGWAMAQPPLGEGPTVVGAGPTTVGPPSPVSSFSTKESPSTSSAAEADATATETATTEGGGGGEIPSSEEQDKTQAPAEALVSALDYRGKPPGQKRRQALTQLVSGALAAGWSEKGLRRYLDISDDDSIRSAAAVYEHRLDPDELPPVAAASPLLPPCGWCSVIPEAATDSSRRVSPITGDPCPRCHPDAPARETKLPPACKPCLEFSPGAATNVRMRTDHLSFGGGPCPRCHPSLVPGDWQWPGMDTADGGLWERAAARARQRTGARAESHTADDYANSSVEDLFARRGQRRTFQPADSNEREFAPRPMIAPPRREPFKNPTDQSVYDEPLLGYGPPVDQSAYDEPL